MSGFVLLCLINNLSIYKKLSKIVFIFVIRCPYCLLSVWCYMLFENWKEKKLR